jgi:hypothetical protein
MIYQVGNDRDMFVSDGTTRRQVWSSFIPHRRRFFAVLVKRIHAILKRSFSILFSPISINPTKCLV